MDVRERRLLRNANLAAKGLKTPQNAVYDGRLEVSLTFGTGEGALRYRGIYEAGRMLYEHPAPYHEFARQGGLDLRYRFDRASLRKGPRRPDPGVAEAMAKLAEMLGWPVGEMAAAIGLEPMTR